MKNSITENEIEQIALSYLQNLGYHYLNGLVMAPDGEHPERQYTDVVLVTRLRDAIDKLNPALSQDAKEEALKKVLRVGTGHALSLHDNENLHRYLTDGVDVEIRTESGIRGEKIYIIDCDNPENNEFLAVNQFTVIEGNQNKRPDIILFVNGLPLVVIELKNAVSQKANLSSAYHQIKTYQSAIPSLFTYNLFNIISDGWEAAYGTVSSSFKYYKPWKTKDGITLESTSDLQMEVLLRGLCNKKTLLDVLRGFVVYEKTEKETIKKIAQYHQYYAVNKAVDTTLKATAIEGDRKAGVVWHTQGSGKSLSMVFYAGRMIRHEQMENPYLGDTDRPQRLRRPTVRYLLQLPTAAAPVASAGQQPPAPENPAERRIGRYHIHHHTEVFARI
jgi:type I restriction enzyme, R subunit